MPFTNGHMTSPAELLPAPASTVGDTRHPVNDLFTGHAASCYPRFCDTPVRNGGAG